jgi:hypothetical protein
MGESAKEHGSNGKIGRRTAMVVGCMAIGTAIAGLERLFFKKRVLQDPLMPGAIDSLTAFRRFEELPMWSAEWDELCRSPPKRILHATPMTCCWPAVGFRPIH